MMKLLYLVLLGVTCVYCQCQNGFTSHDQSCYSLIRIQASWAEATIYCQAMGAKLATVETDSEHLFLTNWVLKDKNSLPKGAVWLGGQDFQVEGEWRWAFPGGRIDKTWWGVGSPDNTNADQHCLTMFWSDNYEWNDDFCQDTYYFVCEAEAQTNPVVG